MYYDYDYDFNDYELKKGIIDERELKAILSVLDIAEMKDMPVETYNIETGEWRRI